MTTKKRHLRINLKATVGKWNGIVNFNGYEIWICIYMYASPQSKPMKKKKKNSILPDSPPTLTWLVGFKQTGGPSYCDLSMICQWCPFSSFLWWYFFRSSILPTHNFFFFLQVCAWINNNANILYLWFKTISSLFYNMCRCFTTALK